MKELTLFYLPGCPHCQRALALQEEALSRHPEYRRVPVRQVDESVETAYADAHDYYFVPTYYVGADKFHEGIVDLPTVEAAFRAAYEG